MTGLILAQTYLFKKILGYILNIRAPMATIVILRLTGLI